MYFDKSVSLYSKSGLKENAKYAAEALFLKAEGTYAQLRAIKISADPKKQQSEMQSKIQLVEKLRAELDKVIELNVPAPPVDSESAFSASVCNLRSAKTIPSSVV